MEKLKYLTLLLFISTFFSCKHKYFTEEMKVELSTIVPEQSIKDYSTYNYDMRAYNYFKNKNENIILLTEGASKHYKDFIKFYKANANIFKSPQQDIRKNKWIQVEMACMKNEDHALEKGSQILITIKSGKDEYCDGEYPPQYSMVKTFQGIVGDYVGNQEDGHQVIYIETIFEQKKAGEISSECVGKKLSFIANSSKDKIKIVGIIDTNYKSDSRKPKLYDISEIFGTHITLTSQKT